MCRAPLRNVARSMSAPTLSFVLPAHNEVRNVAGMAARLAEIARAVRRARDHFRRRRLDRRHADRHPRARGAAIRRSATSPSRAISVIRRRCAPGLRHARGRAVIVMDCDFEHPPEVVGASWSRNGSAAPRSWSRAASTRTATPRRPRRRRRGCSIACSTRSATCISSPAAPTSCCSIAPRSTSSTRWRIRTCSCAGWCAGSASRSRPSRMCRACGRKALRASRCAAWSISP